MSFDDAPEVPLPKSRASTSATARPMRAACAAIPAPTIPPPTTSRSNCRVASFSIALARESAMRGWCRTSAVLVGCGPMPASALALALGSAFLHAFWNLLIARAPDIEAATTVALVTGIVVFAPVAVLAWDADAAVWPYLAVTSLLQLAYFIALTTAYGRATCSFVYPIARGSAPVLVLLGALAILGEKASGAQVVGVLTIAAGVLLVRGIHGRATLGDLALALTVGACIAAYTLVDSRGIRYASPIVYQELSMIPATIGFGLFVLRRRGQAAVRLAIGTGFDRRGARDVRRLHPRPRRTRAGAGSIGGRRAGDERGHRDRFRDSDAARARRAGSGRGRDIGRRRRVPARPLIGPRHRDGVSYPLGT